MAYRLFGFTILTPKEILQQNSQPALVPPQREGEAVVSEGGLGFFSGYSIDFESNASFHDEVGLINQYRDLALQPEVDEAINSIIDEVVVREDGEMPVQLRLDDLPDIYDDSFKVELQEQFSHILSLLDFGEQCYDIVRQFYVDGRLYYDLIINEDNPQEGVIELRNIDPRTIKPVREVRDSIHQETAARLREVVDEYYLYNPMGFRGATLDPGAGGVRVTRDRVAYINSGVFSPGRVTVLSWLHKAIKPFNQMRMVEDALVIYRITRAPERRVFYIDVADLPTAKAESYLNQIATKYSNRVTYDSQTGQMDQNKHVLSMLEDFWLPRRSNGKGTEIQTLPAGENLGETADVDYFKRKLYRALGIPVSRLESNGSQFQLGRTTEITRDEIQFARFLERIRGRFAGLFDEILSRHLVLVGTIKNKQDWDEVRKYAKYIFNSDSYFAELKKTEMMKERLEVLSSADGFVGKYFSEQYVKDKILRLTQEEQQQITDDIAGTASEEEPEPGEDDDAGGQPGGEGLELEAEPEEEPAEPESAE